MERVAFDWDGTLYHSMDNCYVALCETLRDWNIPPITYDQMRHWFGEGPATLFEQASIPPALQQVWAREFHGRYARLTPPTELIEGALDTIMHAERKHAGRTWIITHDVSGVAATMAASFGITTPVRHLWGPKSTLFEELGITTYIGDTPMDGKACIEAKHKPHFIGVASGYGACAPDALYKLQQEHPTHKITIVQDIREAREHL